MDLFGELAGEAEDDIEVVNHEIEHDVNVEAAGSEDAQAVNFEKKWNREGLFKGRDSGVEAFEMTDLQNAATIVGETGEAYAGGCRFGDGFFNEYIYARFE